MNNHICKTFEWAVIKGHRKCVVSLLDKGKNVDEKGAFGWTPLHWASNHSNRDFIVILLDHGASIDVLDQHGWTPLDVANDEIRSFINDHLIPIKEPDRE